MLRPFRGESITSWSGIGLIAWSTVLGAVSAPAGHAMLTLNLFETPQQTPTSRPAGGASRGSQTTQGSSCKRADPSCDQSRSFDGYFCSGIAGAEGDFYGLSLAPPPVANQEIDLLFRSISPLFLKLRRQQLRDADKTIVLDRDCLARGSINAILPAAPYALQRSSEIQEDPLASLFTGAWSLTID